MSEVRPMEHGRQEHRFVLGTVQLGMPYGVANRRGQPPEAVAEEIVRAAWNGGVRFFDTAQAYGESESVLGSCLRCIHPERAADTPNVITKIDPGLEPRDTSTVLEEVDRSFERLGVPELYGLMLHRESWLDFIGNGLGELADSLKARGKIRYFGVSVYSMERAFQAVDTEGIDLIQLPFNVLDQRAAETGFFPVAKARGKQVFIRSVYLQGLLLMKPDRLSVEMAFARAALERFAVFSEQQGVPPQLAAVAFVRSQAPEAFCVLGAETVEQIRDSIRTYGAAGEVELPDMRSLAVSDPRIANPALWP